MDNLAQSSSPHQLRLLPHLAKLALDLGFQTTTLEDFEMGAEDDLPQTTGVDNAPQLNDVKSRCGIPWVGEQDVDQAKIFLLAVKVIEADEPLTTLLRRKCFVQSFFGNLDERSRRAHGSQSDTAAQLPTTDDDQRSTHLGSIHGRLAPSHADSAGHGVGRPPVTWISSTLRMACEAARSAVCG